MDLKLFIKKKLEVFFHQTFIKRKKNILCFSCIPYYQKNKVNYLVLILLK